MHWACLRVRPRAPESLVAPQLTRSAERLALATLRWDAGQLCAQCQLHPAPPAHLCLRRPRAQVPHRLGGGGVRRRGRRLRWAGPGLLVCVYSPFVSMDHAHTDQASGLLRMPRRKCWVAIQDVLSSYGAHRSSCCLCGLSVCGILVSCAAAAPASGWLGGAHVCTAQSPACPSRSGRRPRAHVGQRPRQAGADPEGRGGARRCLWRLARLPGFCG